jgi:hypothetical protein
MLSLEERLRELEEPPGAEMLDLDAILRYLGYQVTFNPGYRAYGHEAWRSVWTFRNDWRIVPVDQARQIVSFLRSKLKEEGRL